MAKEKITARARTQYTDYMVKEPMELMEFLAAKMPDASRTKLKSLLSKRIIYVDSVITTQYNFPLKPGMKVQISREKGRKEFNHKLMKIVYEDAYIIVIEKMQGLLSVNTDRQKERTAYTILNEYVQRSGKQHRVHIVHRLDRDTSGLMMFAKDEKTQRTLRDNWHDIVTDRRYGLSHLYFGTYCTFVISYVDCFPVVPMYSQRFKRSFLRYCFDRDTDGSIFFFFPSLYSASTRDKRSG